MVILLSLQGKSLFYFVLLTQNLNSFVTVANVHINIIEYSRWHAP